MPTRNVLLNDQQETFIATMVESGRYRNAGEVLCAGLCLLENQMERQSGELAKIQAGVVEGLEQAARGEFAEGTGAEAVNLAFRRAREKRGL